nr:protein NLRC5-like [Oncorhynchus nerka]
MTFLKRLNLNKYVTMVTGSPGEGTTLVLLASLEGLRAMEEIELEGMRMSDKGVEELIKHLPTWTGLRKISLSDNYIGDQAGERLIQTLDCGGIVSLPVMPRGRRGSTSSPHSLSTIYSFSRTVNLHFYFYNILCT